MKKIIYMVIATLAVAACGQKADDELKAKV